MKYSKRGLLEQKRSRIAPLVNSVLSEMQFEILLANTLDGKESRMTVVATQDRYGFPCRLALSKDTGVLYLVDRLTPKSYMRFYDQGLYRKLLDGYWERHTHLGVEGQDKMALRNAKVVLNAVHGIITLPPEAILLDIGGSTGVLAKAFQDIYHVHATVLDPSDAELALARDRGLDTLHGIFEEIEFAEDTQFDIILMNQTIEHILDLELTFSKIHKLLKPDGYFVFDIVDFVSEMIVEGSPEAVSRLDHCHFFYDEMIDTFCSRVGLEVQASVSHKNLCRLYICKKAEIDQTKCFSYTTYQQIIRLFSEKHSLYYSTPTILGYSLYDRVRILAWKAKKKALSMLRR